MGHGHEIKINQEQFKFPQKTKTLSIVLIAIGVLLSIIGIISIPKESHHVDNSHAMQKAHEHAGIIHQPEYVSSLNINGVDTLHNNEQLHPVESHAKPWTTRIYINLLANGYYLLLIASCGLLFVAIQYAANAGWATVLLRIPQAISTILPVGAILILLVFIVAGSDIYHWIHYEHQHLAKGDPGFDKILSGKSWFLNTKLVYSFLIALPLVWFLFGKKLRSLSYAEDNEGGVSFFKKSISYSAAFIFIFAFTLSIYSWLVTMAADAHWYSTIFSIYNFATGWVTVLSIIALFALYLRKNGYLKIVTDEHIHDLGKFMFAFSIFWTYLWLAQFLLIWYANIPEETVYYYQRWEMPFKVYFFLNITLNFLLPFLVLMTRNSKRNPLILGTVAILLIFGHWLDIYLMLIPGVLGHQGSIGMLEIGMPLAFAGIFIYWIFTALEKRGLYTIKHPYLEESAHHDVGV